MSNVARRFGDLDRYPTKHNTMARTITLVLIAITSLAGCNTNSPSSNSPKLNSTASNPVATENAAIQVGLYSEGDEYERISSIISDSSARIRLDAHSGIGWNGETIENIDALSPLMNSVADKSIIVISTGKAMWDKEDGYIDNVVEFAKPLGYEQIIVVDDHSFGISVRKVISH